MHARFGFSVSAVRLPGSRVASAGATAQFESGALDGRRIRESSRSRIAPVRVALG